MGLRKPKCSLQPPIDVMITQGVHKKPLAAIASAGVVYCALNAAGIEVFCQTSGCALYRGYSFLGVSLYIYGAIAFLLVAALGVLMLRHPSFENLLYWLVLGILAADTVFLGYQILFWPCLSCLVVAALLGAVGWVGYRQVGRFRTLSLQVVLSVWFAAFLVVGVAAGKEVLIEPWPLAGPSDAEVKVFFSPTCGACRTEVLKIIGIPSLRGKVALFPVAKNDEDLARLADFTNRGGMPLDAIESLFLPLESSGGRLGLGLRWKLVRNKMVLAKMGENQVPFITGAFLPVAGDFTQPVFMTPGFNEETPNGCGAVWEQASRCGL